ncbi:MAG: Ig-like domain-containing protein [Candidatus Delongbacteria bacterium]|nr:Ig-like domain-containing protein [Candidatus Delongbacteria bacterium]
MKIKIFKYISMISMIILVSCATDYRRWPSGGIEDRISPTITYFTPEIGSLNQDKDIVAEIEFDEFIDYASTRNAITISPYSAQDRSRITWYEKSVKIEFSELGEDQTVLIVVNTSLSDLRKNTLKNNFILNFSTGSKIDTKEFAGKVDGAIINKKIEFLNYSKLKVNLYRKGDFRFYDINKINPEYSIGVSSDMSYKFTNVSADNYVPVVCYDKNNNSKIELDDEYIALTDVIDLKTNDKLDHDFTLAKIDTIPPFIKDIVMKESDILEIVLSENVKNIKNILSEITQTDNVIEYEELYDIDIRDKFYIKSNNLDISKEITVVLNEVTDIYSNSINEKMRSKSVFVGDSVKRSILRINSDFSSSIFNDQKIAVKYNLIDPDSLFIELISNVDSSIINLNDIAEKKLFKTEIDLSKKVIEDGKYLLAVKRGEKLIFSKNVNLESELGYGIVSGVMEGSSGSVNIIFQNCKNTNLSYCENVQTTDYKIKLRPGKYLCAAYEDTNSDGIFSLDHNQKSMERSVFLKDTVLVRKNWESGDINFKF